MKKKRLIAPAVSAGIALTALTGSPFFVYADEEKGKSNIEMIMDDIASIKEKLEQRDSAGIHKTKEGMVLLRDNGERLTDGTSRYKNFEFTANENGIITKAVSIDYPQRNQNDYKDGDVLCGPTTFSSVIQFLTGNEINPEDISSMMKSMGSFTPGAGCSLLSSVSDVFNEYEIEWEGVELQFDLVREALLQGQTVVLMTVGSAPWVASRGVLHVMSLHGYDAESDKAFITDTYTPSLSGWYSLEKIRRGVIADESKDGPVYIIKNPQIEVFEH